MNVSAISSGIQGIHAAHAQMNDAAQIAARSGLADAAGEPLAGGDVVDAVTGSVSADLGQSVNIAVLRRAMDMQESVIDILA